MVRCLLTCHWNGGRDEPESIVPECRPGFLPAMPHSPQHMGGGVMGQAILSGIITRVAVGSVKGRRSRLSSRIQGWRARSSEPSTASLVFVPIQWLKKQIQFIRLSADNVLGRPSRLLSFNFNSPSNSSSLRPSIPINTNLFAQQFLAWELLLPMVYEVFDDAAPLT